MKQHLTRQDVTPEVIKAGYAYIAAKAEAQVIAEVVKPIQVEVLTGFEFFNDLSVKHGLERERITDPKDLYLSKNEAAIAEYYAAVDKRLRAKGIKPQDMPVEHCPVLVAEHEQTKAEWALIIEAAKMLDDENPETFNHRLLCQSKGLEKRRYFIETVAKLVVSL
jgi:hypothetical protein